MHWGENIEIFNNFIEATIKFDDKLYERAMNKKYLNHQQRQSENYVKI